MEGSQKQRNRKESENDEISSTQSLSQSQLQEKMSLTAGIVHKISLENFLCHDKLEMEFNPHINFIIGKNGSGKSAVLTGIVVALGERATTTNRGQSVKDFIKTGRNHSVVKVTLLNKGLGSYQQDVYGDYITIVRTIKVSGTGGYKILNEQGRVVSTKRDELNRILAKMNLQVDNPVCILNQETAKNFLHSNDPKQKYKLFERATQMDIMYKDLTIAEEELSRSKCCLKEKLGSLEHLKSDLQKWQARNEWYQAMDEIQEQRTKLENMIAWAQVEELAKQVNEVEKMVEQQKSNLELLMRKKEDNELKLRSLEETYRTRHEEVAFKRREIDSVRSSQGETEKEQQELQHKLRQILQEIRLLENDKRRFENDKRDLIKAISNLKTNDHGEFARRQEERRLEMEKLQQREEELHACRKVTEHQMEQLRSAMIQLRAEIQAIRSESSRYQRDMDQKLHALNELKKSDGNQFSVFGDWVPVLLKRMERTKFNEIPKGPVGAYIKLRDKSWAPAVESLFGHRLHTFIVSTDEDAKRLNRLFEEVIPRGPKPPIVTTRITGTMYNVGDNEVRIEPELQNRDIHPLLDMLIIDDPDIANLLIDMNSIEQTLLIGNDRDARHLLSNRSTVPRHCRMAITKEGNTYFPDPNYRSYAGHIRRARYLQVSVEETIRGLEEEVEYARQEKERVSQNLQRVNNDLQRNECEARAEESKLTAIKRELNSIRERNRILESQQEPEPLDVQVFEEDLEETDNKLEAVEKNIQSKQALYDEIKSKYQEMKENNTEIQRKIAALATECDPIRDVMKQIESKKREVQEVLTRLNSREEVMKNKLKEFENDLSAAKTKEEMETAKALRFCERVVVTKPLKALNSELRQIVEQIAAQEKEYGSREYVFNEFRRRKEEYEQAKSEVVNSQRSYVKLVQMAKLRKEFMAKFRESIMVRTHYVFQALLKTRHFEGELQFNTAEKTLTLLVNPPGRNNEGIEPPTSKRSRSCGTDIRSLSGGERSFATVCFIIALWDAIESPFRVLDEFDVFMDYVNRRISMDLLINEANENSKRQYIFLTPLGLELENQPNIHIWKMADPERQTSSQDQS